MLTVMNLYKPKQYCVLLQGQHIKSASLNEHIQTAREWRVDKVLFVDVDMKFPADTIPALLRHQQPIVSGLYHLKSWPHSPVCGWVDEDQALYVNGNGKHWKYDYCPLPDNQLVEVDWCGIGCLMVDMKVFDKLEEIDGPHPFYDTWNHEKGVRQLGHDVVFCRAAKAVGYKVYVDTGVDCGHRKTFEVNKLYVQTAHKVNLQGELENTIKKYTMEPGWWDVIWREKHLKWQERDSRRILEIVGDYIPKDASVLDIGCGCGNILRNLMEGGWSDVEGWDFSEESINFLSVKGIPGKVVDIREYDYNPADRHHTVILSHVLEHMPADLHHDILTKLSQLATHQVIIAVPKETWENLYVEHQHAFETEEDLKKVLEPYFEQVTVGTHHGSKHAHPEYRHLIARCITKPTSGEDSPPLEKQEERE